MEKFGMYMEALWKLTLKITSNAVLEIRKKIDKYKKSILKLFHSDFQCPNVNKRHFSVISSVVSV